MVAHMLANVINFKIFKATKKKLNTANCPGCILFKWRTRGYILANKLFTGLKYKSLVEKRVCWRTMAQNNRLVMITYS